MRFHLVWFSKPQGLESSLIRFIIVGEELTKTGRTHYQGYAELYKSVSFKRLKRLFGRTVHIERARKSAIHNIAYCTKEGRLYYIRGRPTSPRAALLIPHFSKSRSFKNAKTSEAPSNNEEQEEVFSRRGKEEEGLPQNKLQKLAKSSEGCAIQQDMAHTVVLAQSDDSKDL
jgi:hypothetical protein